MSEEDSKKCHCDLCKLFLKSTSIIRERNVDDLIALVKEVMDLYINADFDASYYKCLLNGSWPNSVERLERALVKAKEQQSKEK